MNEMSEVQNESTEWDYNREAFGGSTCDNAREAQDDYESAGPICECGPVRWQSGPRYGQHADTCPAK